MLKNRSNSRIYQISGSKTKDPGSSCLSVLQPRQLAFPLSLLPRSSKVVSVVLDPMFSYNPVGRQKRRHFSLIVFLSGRKLIYQKLFSRLPFELLWPGYHKPAVTKNVTTKNSIH